MALLKHQRHGPAGPEHKYQTRPTTNGEDMISVTHVVHTITITGVEDPDIMVGEPMYEWSQTEAGKWVMENSNPTPSWHRHAGNEYGCRYAVYGYLYEIRAYLTPEQLTYWKLKFE